MGGRVRAARCGGRASVVDFPDPEDSTEFDFDRGSDGMPERTQRAFQAHADQELGDRPDVAIAEIERVYEADETAVISVSGGKDSLATLALASEVNYIHRALHWDYGPDLVPRDTATKIVELIREHVSDPDFFVANEMMHRFAPYNSELASRFRYQLNTSQRLASQPSIRDTQDGKPIARLISRLQTSRERGDVGKQILGLRAGESGSRARKLDGLYGKSLGFPTAFPLRDWSARDVWAYLVDNEIPYPPYYDRVAAVRDDGGPRAYERARMSVWHRDEPGTIAPESIHGVAEWRCREVQDVE